MFFVATFRFEILQRFAEQIHIGVSQKRHLNGFVKVFLAHGTFTLQKIVKGIWLSFLGSLFMDGRRIVRELALGADVVIADSLLLAFYVANHVVGSLFVLESFFGFLVHYVVAGAARTVASNVADVSTFEVVFVVEFERNAAKEHE